MQLDLEGRVKNIFLSPNNSLLPVFEAIKNSIDAVSTYKKIEDSKITIFLVRDKTQRALEEDETFNYPISDFIVEDNGPGFNSENYSAFETSDTRFKVAYGGKGIGRFLWLKAFDLVTIESIYEENSALFKRNFTFQLAGNGIDGGQPIPVSGKINQTRVHLEHLKSEFREGCPKKADTIAHKIIEHFLPVFTAEKCPKILLIDDNSERIDLNSIFNSEYKANSKKRKFEVKDQEFKMIGIKISSNNPNNHRISFCADDREVIGEQLKDYIPDLSSALKMDDKSHFVFHALISGDFLNKTVNAERDDFDIPKKSVPLNVQDISLADIRQNSLNEIKTELEPYLDEIKKNKLERIKTYVRTKAPQYRHLMKYGEEKINNIPPEIPDNSLEIELYKISQDVELDVKTQGKQFLDTKINDIREKPEYQKRYNDFLEKLNDTGKANIAKYIVHRKLMLDLLENALKIKEDDTYPLEEDVHNMIFPIRATSDDVSYDQHNLWILDEKLAYHYFLASDKRLDQIDIIDNDSQNRCDLLVFNNPVAFADQKDELSSLIIIEFKRPMRKIYSEKDDNPIDQVYDYVRDLRTKNKVDKEGRPIRITSNTPIYAYIVCDITPKMDKIAVNAGFIPMDGGKGYFGNNTELRVYTEVLSYDKVLMDSQKRNRVLFDKLNIL